jgi:hypothetical protein
MAESADRNDATGRCSVSGSPVVTVPNSRTQRLTRPFDQPVREAIAVASCFGSAVGVPAASAVELSNSGMSSANVGTVPGIASLASKRSQVRRKAG